MQQSIASSQVDVDSRRLPEGDWRSILAWLWKTTVRTGHRMVSRVLSLIRRWRASVSDSVDLDEIASRLAIEERGMTDGANEEPASAEQELTGTQKEIVVHFKEMQRRAVAKAALLNDKIRGLRESMDFSQAIGTLNDIPTRTENKILKLNAEFQSQLDFLGERQLQQQNHYAAFREVHHLDRVADYPKSSLSYYALILVLIGAGAVAISNFAGPGLDGSYSLPPAWTLSVATLAVLVPFVLGAGIIRSINHIGEFRTLIGWLGGGLAVAFIGALAYFVGYYTWAMSADPELGWRAAMDSLLLTPNALGTDLNAWTACVVVALLGLLALLVGYRSDDAYPGYGAVQRAYYRARDEREFLTKRMRKKIYGLVDEAKAEATRAPKRLRSQVKRYARMVDQANRRPEDLSDYRAVLEDACNILLDRYRAANRGSRKTAPPQSFSERAHLGTESESISNALGTAEHRLDDVLQGMAEVEKEVGKTSQRLKDLNWRSVNALEDLPEYEDSPRDAGGHAD